MKRDSDRLVNFQSWCQVLRGRTSQAFHSSGKAKFEKKFFFPLQAVKSKWPKPKSQRTPRFQRFGVLSALFFLCVCVVPQTKWAGRVQTWFTEENILYSACAGLRCVKQDQQNDLSRSPAAAGTAANPSERRSHLRTVAAKVGTGMCTQHARDAFLVLGVQFRCFSPEGQGSC